MTNPLVDPREMGIQEVLVHDAPEPCPYRTGVTARMPLRLQFEPSGERLDTLLSQGDRRVGPLMYRPTCPTCNACQSLRIPLDHFEFRRSHRRVVNRNADLELRITSPPVVDTPRVELFNRHRKERGLSRKRLGRQGYRAWLSQTWTETLEFAWYKDGNLVCVSIVDRGKESSSAVYCHYDPSMGERSLGTLAILKAIEWGKQKQLKWHYLGLYVEDNSHLSYKARFRPHERLINGIWTPSESSGGTTEL